MKKSISTLFIALLPTLTSAQTAESTYIDHDQIALGATVLLVAFILVFLLELTNRYFQYRLKEKVLESGVTEQLAALLLKPDPRENLRACIKWIAIFLGLPLGFAIIAL